MVHRHAYLRHLQNRDAMKRNVFAPRFPEINPGNTRRTAFKLYIDDHVDAHEPKSAAESPSKAIFWHVYDVLPFGDVSEISSTVILLHRTPGEHPIEATTLPSFPEDVPEISVKMISWMNVLEGNSEHAVAFVM